MRDRREDRPSASRLATNRRGSSTLKVAAVLIAVVGVVGVANYVVLNSIGIHTTPPTTTTSQHTSCSPPTGTHCAGAGTTHAPNAPRPVALAVAA